MRGGLIPRVEDGFIHVLFFSQVLDCAEQASGVG